MGRFCARPGCNAPAAATFNFDGLNRVVWLNGLADAAAHGAGDLCARHAERLTPPRNWELRDCRPTRTSSRPAPTAPSRQCAPIPERTPEPVAGSLIPVERPAASIPAAAHGRDHAPRIASAKTPLLARAFRGTGGD